MAQAPDLTLFARLAELARSRPKINDDDTPGLAISELGRADRRAERLPPVEPEAQSLPPWLVNQGPGHLLSEIGRHVQMGLDGASDVLGIESRDEIRRRIQQRNAG